SFLETIPGIGAEKAEAIQTDAARVIELEKEEFAQIKAGEEAVAREQAKQMFDEYAHRQTLLPEEDRIVRVKGVGSETVAKLAEAGILFVEDLVDVTNLIAIAEKAGITNERLDELIHAGKIFLEKERKGEELAVSSDDAGPEEGYEPSELLNSEPEAAEEVAQEA
ncbi:MAG: helix-hairpin-helix domain-containing protein, partial [Myxococcota bacterium]|nr:helix-hairpin-helix domain-containing protein [Myxococcota bacterium]